MQPFPHQYIAAATAAPEGEVSLSSEGIVSLPSAPPVPFGGPGDRWSPETLLTAAVADCFILTFRAISAASKLAWTDIRVQSTGTLDTVDRVPQFTAFALPVELRVPAGTSEALATRLLEKTEKACLVAQSLKATPQVTASVMEG